MLPLDEAQFFSQMEKMDIERVLACGFNQSAALLLAINSEINHSTHSEIELTTESSSIITSSSSRSN
jgi:hypothetical protein